MRFTVTIAVLLFFAISLEAEPFACGTSAENDAFVAAAAELVQLRQMRRANKAASAPVALMNNVFVVRADDTNAPYGRYFDLAGKTVELTPAGEEAFTAHVGALDWIDDRGQELTGGATRTWTLTRPFTIFGREVRTLYVTERNSIHLDSPQLPTGRQLGDWELTSFAQPVIAPFFLTDQVRAWMARPTVRVRELTDALLVTWESSNRLAVQAAIFADGRIRFSYSTVTLPSGGVVVTTGAEQWRNVRTPLVEASDAAGDVVGAVPSNLRRMLDIEHVTMHRLSDLDLTEVRIRLAEAPVYSRISAGSSVAWHVTAGESATSQAAARVIMTANGPQLRATIPVFGGTTSTPAATLDGRTLIVRLPDSFLEAAPRVTVSSRSDTTTADVVDAQTLALPPPARRMSADLSAADGTTLRMPVVEAFTLPVLVPPRIWEQLRADHSLTEEDVDAVAIYQNFPTDIRLYASAYALSGNAGASGLRPGDSGAAGSAKEPALLHMSMLDAADDAYAAHLLLHEFGHRWLWFLRFMDNGSASNAMNPASAHPAQYVHTPAAFDVRARDDASVMGGGTFTDNRNGTFTSGSGSNGGYSWIDLYLMGLASPQEVQPFFYLANTDPPLDDAYYAPPDTTVKGTRRNVTVQQVIAANGTRLPAYPETQRRFRIAFVLLSNGEPASHQLDRMHELRLLMAQDFATATGGRAELTTEFAAPEPPPPAGPRRRSVRK